MPRGSWNIVAAVVAVVALAAGGPWLVGQLRSLPGTRPLASRSQQRVVTLEITGMTCSACAAKIGKELTATPGVATAEVRVAQDLAYVVCDREMPDSTLIGVVHRAGPGYFAMVRGN